MAGRRHALDPLTPQVAVAALACAIAIVTDVREGKIYNWTTLTLCALGIAMNTTYGNWQFGLIGLGVAFAIHWGLWKLGVQKGGDAKLMIGVGAALGVWFMLEATLWYAVLYLPVGLGTLLVTGNMGNLARTAQWNAAKRQGLPEPFEEPEPTMMRTAPVIAAAVAASFFTPWLDGIIGS